MQFKKYIEHFAPEILVQGGEFPPGKDKQLIATIAQAVQMGFILFIIFGEVVFSTLGMPVPEFYQKI